MAKNGMETVHAHVAEHAAYGGHDGKGGLQRPTERKSKPAKKPSPVGQEMIGNGIPVTGPATGAGMLGGPVGTGSIGGK
jgi:hypothetical protein